MEKNIYGYIRVSTFSQHDDRQRMAMENFGIPSEHVFADKQSGKDFDRPAYNKLITQLEKGDTLVIKSLDRLGRDYDEMIRQLDIITRQKEVALVVLDLPLLDTRNKYGNDSSCHKTNPSPDSNMFFFQCLLLWGTCPVISNTDHGNCNAAYDPGKCCKDKIQNHNTLLLSISGFFFGVSFFLYEKSILQCIIQI